MKNLDQFKYLISLSVVGDCAKYADSISSLTFKPNELENIRSCPFLPCGFGYARTQVFIRNYRAIGANEPNVSIAIGIITVTWAFNGTPYKSSKNNNLAILGFAFYKTIEGVFKL